MTRQGKTFKDTKDLKERNSFFKANKDPHPLPKGGHTNLLREALEALREEDLPEIFLGEVEDV